MTVVSRGSRLPLPFGQQRLWLRHQAEPGSSEYTVLVPARFTGELNVAALGAALDGVVARHEALRTRLLADPDGTPCQVIYPPSPVALPVVDVSVTADPLAVARALLTADRTAPFDLAAGPPLRACLVRLAPNEHLLLLSAHRAVCDAWSAGILSRELAVLYAAAGRGEPDPLPPLPLQYADFALWQRAWLTTDVLDGQLAYWRDRLAGLPALDLPADRPRPPVRSAAGATVRFAVPAEVTGGLRAAARVAGATMFTTLLSAFTVLLSRYCGTEDLVVGAEVANRDPAETADMIGYFANMLALRADLSGDPSFTELLDRVHATELEAYAHQQLPFERLVDELATGRNRSRTPLVQVLLRYDQAGDGQGGDDQGGAWGSAVGLDAGGVTAQVDLRLQLAESGDGLTGAIEYGTALFEEATITRLAGHLGVLLTAIAGDPRARVSGLPLLTPAERHRMLAAWNDTAVPEPDAAGTHQLITERAAAAPDATAVVSGDECLTYAGLLARARRLAGYLRAAGARPESVVGLCLERGPDMITAVLAIWLAGGAYLPLDPAYPPARLAYLLADSRSRLLITDGSGQRPGPDLPAGVETVLLGDPAVRAGIAAAPPAPAMPARPGQLAYVIYTSGSTGQPKGVQVTHGALMNYLAFAGDAYPGARAGSVLHSSVASDLTVTALLVPLTLGGRVHVAGLEDPRLPSGTVSAGLVKVTPSHLLLLDQLREPVGCVDLVVGGEQLTAELLAGWRARGQTAVTNEYGPTEATVGCVSHRVGPGDALSGGVVPVGRPVRNTQVYVLDRYLNPVPAGVTGELFIGGTQLARGYAYRPALTAERFVPDPFGRAGGRLYRTGDRARWRPDGRLEFLGRADDQVKVRGFRVEPGEVEAALSAHPAVSGVAVAVTGEREGTRLAAWLVPTDAAAGIPPATQLRDFLAGRLPEFMIPAVFTGLAALPLTANGKLDRAALPAPDTARPATSVPYVAPRGEREELLAGIWAQVLGLDQVGAEDNFFALGGHSLLATRVISRARPVLGAELTLSAVFDHPTVAGLARLAGQAGSALSPVPPLTRVPRDQALPLSFAQQRLWFVDQFDPGSAEYNVPSPLRLSGELNVRALGAALDAITARHEVLRTRLVAGEDGVPFQVADQPSPVPLPVADVSGAADPFAAARALVAADAVAAFDLAAGPVIRACLARLAPGEHVLVLSVHHAAFDEWSADIFKRELFALHDAYRRGAPDPLPALPVQYADFAVWQRQWLAGDVLDRQFGYWRAQLAGLPVLDLPADRRRPAVRSAEGAAVRFAVSAGVTRGLREVARQGGATMFMTSLAAFAVLLSRYTGLADIVVGTPAANRDRAETEGLIGFFVNTLVMRADLAGDPTFAELLGRVRATALDAYAHQDLPFEHLVDELVTVRDRSRTPLFQVLLNYFTAAGGQPAGWENADGLAAGVITQVDLRLILTEDGAGLAGTIEYSTALFDAATVERVAGHLSVLLAGVAAGARRPLSSLPLLTAAERAEIVSGWNDTFAPVPDAGGVPELIAARAQACPDSVAVASGGQFLSYGALQARAARLAGYLRQAGVGPETVVGLCLDRGPDMVAAILAVWRAGGGYLPLDPGYPPDRLAFMLADSRASVLVGTAAALDDLPSGRLRVITVDDPSVRAGIAAATPAPSVPAAPGQLAYVIYTSGSAGAPKGVQVTRGDVLNLAVALRPVLGVGPGTRVLHFASFSFDGSVLELAVTPAAGGTLVMAGPEQRSDPAALARLVRAAGVDVATLPASLLSVLRPGDLDGLATLVAAGERLDGVVAAAWSARPHRLVNGYGPTEATVLCCTGPVGPAAGPVPPIGSPVANVRAYVLDQCLNPVPAGVPGELFIAGAQVARGYLARPALTAERFVASPFGPDGERLYRTGDLARWLPAGVLEYLGRADEQVKVRGFRVEPGEVEAALADHPAVTAAAVAVTGQRDEARLAAWLVPADPARRLPPSDELREFVAGKLPEFMIPAVFTGLAALPLTPNGKVDRAALPAPEVSRSGLGPGYLAPRTETEKVLAGIWAQVLGLDQVGADDDFFELGGHSLLATQVLSRVRDGLGAEVPVAALFDHPTVAGLASVIARTAVGPTAAPVRPAPRTGRLPLSFAQQRLWFLAQLDPESAEYNVPSPVWLPGTVDVAALEAALAALTARHEVLRTRLVAGHEGEPYQEIDPPAPFPLMLADVSGAADPRELTESLVIADMQAPFDLAAGPVARACLVRLAPADHVLVLSLHHVVSDEWSAGILRRELGALYAACSRGGPDPLPPLPVQYADYAVWQRAWLTGQALESQLAYWRRQLASLPAVELPVDHPRPPVRSTEGTAAEFSVPATVAGGLRDVAQRGGASMFMTVLAAVMVLLGRYAGTDTAVVGTLVANRNRAETEGLIGFFINTLVMRVDLSGDPSFAELLGRVRQVALEAYAGQDLPFDQLVDELVTERDRSRTPLFQVMFNHRGADGAGAGPALSEFPVRRAWLKYDLSVTLDESGGGLAGVVRYSTVLFEPGTVARLTGHLNTLLAAVAAHPQAPLRALPMLSAGEREQLLTAWNDTAAALPAAGGVHELIAARAAQCPDAVAVVAGDACLTYAALTERVGRLAAVLRESGVGPETVVGLCLPRGAAMVTAILATWLAGGAYVPLDPGYPAERLAFMLADSRAGVLVANRAAAAGLGDGLPAGPDVLLLDDPATAARIAGAPPGAATRPRPGQLAYMIYTSGSTGRPKGVQVTHGSVVNLVTGMGPVLGAAPGSRVLQFASFSFDAAVLDLAAGLAAGAVLVVVGAADRAEPSRVTALARAQGIQAASVAPSLLALLDPRELTAVTSLIVGSEPVSAEIARLWGPGRRMSIGYGPTETTVICCTGLVRAQAAGAPPIGGPVANTRVYVLDRHLDPVPVGVIGEVFIGGAQLARGYHARPGLTAERFVADPLGPDGGRLYRTGDRARWRADGVLEFAGRADGQVKVRGFRVEPGEVEAVLAAHPSVGAVAVGVIGSGPDARLAAWLVPADHRTGIPPASELRAYATGRLPEFMVPAVFTGLAALPLTPSGKLDRAVLPAPGTGRPELGDRYLPPRTETERVLAGIWSQILGLDRVGAQDNFFELGGHSLLATRMISRIRRTLGADIPLTAVFDTPTVAGLAALVDGPVVEGPVVGGPVAERTAAPVIPVRRDQPLPLSFAQQRLWFLAQLEPGSVEYNAPFPLRLGGELNVPALAAALSAVTARHEVLRTRLVAGQDGVPFQVIDPPSPFPLPVADVSGAADPLAAVRPLLVADVRAPFDLAVGPVVRACLVRLAASDHLLLLSLHHVASDEWSGQVLRRELRALYDAFRRGEPDPLPALPVQYADYAVWQRKQLTADVLGEQLGYWREQLAGLPPVELPAGRPRLPVRSTSGAVTRFAVPGPTAEGLRAVARDAGASMFMTALAAFMVVLGRHAGQDDIAVGTPVADRSQAETEGLIGFFVNTLVLRGDLSGDPSFADLLHRVRAMVLAAYTHQDLPFEQLVDELVTVRDRSRTPLFQVFFGYDAQDAAGPETDWVTDIGDPARDGLDHSLTVKCDLELLLAERGGGLTGSIEYCTALFDEAAMGGLAGHLGVLLAAVAAAPGVPLSALTMLTPSEREQLVAGWNDTATPVPDARGVHELIAARAAERPDAVAVVAGDTCLTYAGLAGRASRLAGFLRQRGAGPESVVGLCLDRGADMVVAILATWLAGAAYLPLDPAYPAARLAFMVADSGAGLVLTAGSGPADLPAGVAAVRLDDPAVQARITAAEQPPAPPAPGQLAYVIYTSGSTGTPKGVQIAHGSVVNLVTGLGPVLGVGAGERVLQFASFSFDAAVLDVTVTLASGAALVIADGADRAEPARLAALIGAAGVQAASVTPSLLAVLDPESVPGMRTVLSGAEFLTAPLAAAWGRRRRLVNTYGPTEATVMSVTVPVDPAAAGAPPIGAPVANTQVYVLDQCLNPVPPGVPGELFIGGAQLARGYHARPALTAERFVADPFAADGGRLYRTGDRARWRADGVLEFAGRTDEQVKVRGFRVEPGEVEAALAAHPGVRTAAVAAVGQDTDARLAAWVVPADPAAGLPDAHELRAFLGARLPEFMIPAVFTELAFLPLNPNGKLDRAALPAPDAARPALGDGHVAPRTDIERVLTGIWAQVLGLDRVGVEDNFFDLGGDSIISIRVVAQARRSGIHLTAAQMFEHQTVAGLAAIAVREAAPEAEQGTVAGEFPLTPVQREFFANPPADPSHFNQSVLLTLPGPVDERSLRTAVRALLEQHDALRSRFACRDGRWTGRVVPAELAEVLWVADGDDLASADAAQASLDLEAGPLLRLVLLGRPGQHRRRLLIAAHHLVVDAVSWPILLDDLSAACARAGRGLDPELPAKTTSFVRWAERLAELAASAEVASEVPYWQRVAAVPGRVPRDREGRNTRASASQVRAALPERDTERLLREVPAAYRTQINDVLLTALGIVLNGWVRTASVVVDVEGHGREDVGANLDVSRTVGWFTSVYPVALSATGSDDRGAALRRTKEELRAIPRHGLGYGLLRHIAGAVHGPDPDVRFNYLGHAGPAAGPSEFEISDESLGREVPDDGERRYPIDVSGRIVGGQLEFVWTYSAALHDDAAVARLAGRYIEVLTGLIEHCCAPGTGGYTPSDFPLAGLDQKALDLLQQTFSPPTPSH
jgi:amino acid adenylation domain-containing protein/non-ribosomal peptide synthase protein (TIGR01720 family)